MSFFIDDNNLEICSECDAVLKHKNNFDTEALCPECGRIYNLDIDNIKHESKFTTVIELAESAEPAIVSMQDYSKVDVSTTNKKQPEPDQELKKYGTTILTDELTTYD